jgi:hypothetical protein
MDEKVTLALLFIASIRALENGSPRVLDRTLRVIEITGQ